MTADVRLVAGLTDEEIDRLAEKDGPAPVRQLHSRPRTDLGNAERLVDRFGVRIRYVPPRKLWLVWDGRRWRADRTGEIDRLAKQTIREGYAEATRAKSDDEARAIAKHFAKSEDAARIAAMVKLASTEAGIPALPEDFDADLFLLNAPNGTIELRSGRLREHRKADMMTREIATAYHPDALCPRWLRFLAEVFSNDLSVIDYLQRAIGYTLTGAVSEQVLFFLLGRGSNGKSTLLNILRKLLGDYATQCAPDILLAKRGEAHPTEQMDLYRARLAICTEIEEGRRLAENTVKQLTGGDAIKARGMRENFWQFDPTHKFWIGANNRPIVRGTDYAIWRRIHLIPFDVQFTGAQKDPELLGQLLAELEGILAWCVRGCVEWSARGLDPPERVLNATANYRQESDTIGTWLDERTCPDNSATTKPKTLHDDYVKWCAEQGERAVSQKVLGKSLLERGYEKTGSKGRQEYAGILLREGAR